MVRLSYSQIDVFLKCRRRWYLDKVEKPEVEQDRKFLDRGTLVHACLEIWYGTKPSLDKLREIFEIKWIELGLDQSFPNGKEETWSMIQYGIELDFKDIFCERKVEFTDPHINGTIDVLDAKKHWVADYKTSSSTSPEYRHQLAYYAYFYYMKTGIIPTGTVYYLKLRQKEDFTFTRQDLVQVQNEIKQVNDFIDGHNEKEDYVKCCSDGSQCHAFCNYKEICFPKRELVFHLGLKGNFVYLVASEVDKKLETGLMKSFSFQVTGAEYATKNSSWDGVIRLYNPRYKCLAIGFLDRLLKVLEEYCDFIGVDFNYEIQDFRVQPKLCHVAMPDKLFGVELRDYQVESVAKFLNRKVGIEALSVGAGKSEVGCEIIRKLGVKTLWLTHKKELLIQSRDRIKLRLGIDVGTIQGETSDIKDVTVAMVQTLNSRYEQYKEYLKTVELVVVDEAQHCVSDTFLNILKVIPACYRLGLTGSYPQCPEKMYIESMLGSIVHEITSKELIDDGHLSDPEVIMYRVENAQSYYNWADAEKNLIVCNEKRNLMIKKICEDYPGFSVIIVTKIEHGNLLNELIPNSVFLNGQLSDDVREEMMTKARSGQIKVLISTVLGEGVDLPSIENLIFASGMGKSFIPVVQAGGRVLRKHGTTKKRIFDFYDLGKYVSQHSKYRRQVYEGFAKVNLI